MRNVRFRRRVGLFLALLCAACAIIFVEDRIEAFVPDVKNFAEAKIGDVLGGSCKFMIGDIDGGLLRPFVLSDVRIEDVKGASVLPGVRIASVGTSYRIWDVLYALCLKPRGTPGQGLPVFLLGVSRVDIKFITPDKTGSAFIRLENDSGKVKASGHIALYSAERVDFKGSFKDGVYGIEFRPRHGIVTARGSFSEKDKALVTSFRAHHLYLGGLDLVCDGVLKICLPDSAVNGERQFVYGSVETRNCLINYKPFLNLKADFEADRDKFEIKRFSLSDVFIGNGSFQTEDPHDIEYFMLINNLSLNWLALALGSDEEKAMLTGTMSGKLAVKGPVSRPQSDIKIEVRNGSMGGLDFEFLSAHFKGDGSAINIEDSRVTRDSGYFVIAGNMDLKNIGKNSLFESIRLVGDDKAVNWDGWNTTRVQNMSEVSMKKRLNDDLSLDFKKFISDDTVDEAVKKDDEVQLEYKLHPNESLKMTIGQDRDFLGLEHKNKF